MGTLSASKKFGVPRTTIRNYLRKSPENYERQKLGKKPVLPQDIEAKLVTYCLDMEKNFFGLTRNDVKRMAFQLASQNNLDNPFSGVHQSAGRKWLKQFIQRNPNLTIRTPQSLSKARITGFNEENVRLFFGLLKAELDKIKHNPLRIYNVDETGITCVQNKNVQIISLKGKRAVYKLSSGERGKLVTVVTCMSASGQFIPPMIVFPRKRAKAELLDGAPPGSIAGYHPSGWIQSDLFCQWMAHFASYTKPTVDDPVVLILDGHYSHTRNLEVIEFARKHFISIICLPPHTTHKLQPLDVAFMKPFKAFYNQEIKNWLSTYHSRVITHFQIGEIMGRACIRAATMTNAISGFRATGIYPFNDTIFSPQEFLQEAIEIQQDQEIQSSVRTNSNPILPADIINVPTVPPTKARKKTGEAVLITSSPYKKQLEDFYSKKDSIAGPSGVKDNKKPTHKKSKAQAVKSKKRNVKRRLFAISSSSEKFSENELQLVDTDDDLDPLSDDDTDALCGFCNELFSENSSGEDWIKCSKCFSWFHRFCDAAFEENKKIYICTFCLNKTF